ncbi:MAG TPA: hypothetical protein PLH29_03865 [bacterium]|nr:hypothetical protein [bacterium]
MVKKIFYLSALISLTLILAVNYAQAADFNPNFIISDEEILNSGTMSVDDIQKFLESKNSFLASYRCANADGIQKTAAEIIYDAAADNYDCDGIKTELPLTLAQKRIQCKKISINPKFLIVLLQKEQGLIENTSPSPSALDWATGYGCPDGGGCNERWRGFGKQVNSAALQFYDYIVNPQFYSYKAGNTYNITNTNKPDMAVTPLNNATAALYNYTPHVYNGNYNFWKLWRRYFTVLYPNNTLLQVKGESGVWLIQDGKKRPFLTRGALTSRFDINKIIQVNEADLEKFPTGAPIKYPQYSLVRSPRGTVFLLVDDKKRGFTNQEALRKIGVNPEEIIEASWEDLNIYKDGEPITATTSYPTGALLQDKKTGGVYYVSDGTKAPIWDRILLTTKFKYKLITPVDPKKLESYKTIEPAIFNDGELLKSASSPSVYVIDSKTKRPFISGEIFEKLGYKWSNVITVSDKILDLYPLGSAIDQVFTDETATTTDASISTSTPSNIASGTDANTNAGTTTGSANGLQEEISDIINPGN